jgi:hypothetical protein
VNFATAPVNQQPLKPCFSLYLEVGPAKPDTIRKTGEKLNKKNLAGPQQLVYASIAYP